MTIRGFCDAVLSDGKSRVREVDRVHTFPGSPLACVYEVKAGFGSLRFARLPGLSSLALTVYETKWANAIGGLPWWRD